MNSARAACFVVLFVGVFFAPRTDAAALIQVRDLISTSLPSATTTDHLIEFTLTNAVPVSGHITLTAQSGAYTPQTGFDYTDVDMLISNGGAFFDRTLAATASVAADGVSVSGAGVITITLGDSAIPAGNRVRILLGRNASHGDVGDRSMINPITPGSYRVVITTSTASNVALDSAQAMIAIVQPVQAATFAPPTAPTRFNGMPTTTVAANNDEIELSLETDEPATCRYATTTDILYDDMENEFTSASTLHYTTVTGHENNTSYIYYVRCEDQAGAENDDDYPISFSLDVTPISNTSTGIGGSDGQGGVGDIPGGSAVLYLADMSISGFAPPGSTVHMLRDGAAISTTIASGNGSFTADFRGLERGAYTFGMYAEDSEKRLSSTHSVTMTLESGTQNELTNIMIPPTISGPATAATGEEVRLRGEAPPGSSIDVYIRGASNQLISLTASTTAVGRWEVTVPRGRLSRGAYDARARASMSGRISMFSKPASIAVGGAAASTGTSDVNGDAKVNLVDFSIMLSAWGTDEASVDFNSDGTVNLADFSILLFNWTG
ncbi:MAG: dockerin type I domain-containing protein [Minisyncoccia bacterium]